MEKKFEKKSFSKKSEGDAEGGGYKDKGDRDGGGDKKSWRRRERPALDLIIDYKDIETIKPFLSEGGRMVPARVNRLNRQQQKQLTAEVKRARQLALVPVSDRHAPAGHGGGGHHDRGERGGYGGGRDRDDRGSRGDRY